MMESIVHAALTRPTQATVTALEQLGFAMMKPYMAPCEMQPIAPLPYVAPSVAGYQTVPLAQMSPEDARASLLAMDLSPQFLDAMKADLQHCTNPLSPGWNLANQHQFVTTYGHLVAMPAGLDSATVAALNRMLASPEPPTPTAAQAAPRPQAVPVHDMPPEDARAALLAMDLGPQFLDAMKADLQRCTNPFSDGWSPASQQQFVATYGHVVAMPDGLDGATTAALNRMLAAPATSAARANQPRQAVPVGDMSPEDASAALQALEVPPAVIDRMTIDVLACLEAAGTPEGEQRANQFRQDHGHLLALPERMNMETLFRLLNTLQGVYPAEPDQPAAARAQVQESPPCAGHAPLHTLEPADVLQQLFALGLQESQLRTMAAHLRQLDALAPEMGGDEQIYARQAHEFSEVYGPLFNMPLQMDLMTRLALARILEPFSEDEQ